MKIMKLSETYLSVENSFKNYYNNNDFNLEFLRKKLSEQKRYRHPFNKLLVKSSKYHCTRGK